MAGKCKVYKKTSSNKSLTVYLTQRDFLEDQGRQLVPVAGVVQFTDEQLRDDRLFCLVNLTYRYGREADETMAHTFKRTIQLLNAPINVSSDRKLEQQTVDDNHIDGEVCGEGKLAKILHYDEEKEMEVTRIKLPERPPKQREVEENEKAGSGECVGVCQTRSNGENLTVDQSNAQQGDQVGCSKQKEESVVHGEGTSEEVTPSVENVGGESEKKEAEACTDQDNTSKTNKEGNTAETTGNSNETIEEQDQNKATSDDQQAQEPVVETENEQKETGNKSEYEQNEKNKAQANEPHVEGQLESEVHQHPKNLPTDEEKQTESQSVYEEETKAEKEFSKDMNSGKKCGTESETSKQKELEEKTVDCNTEEKHVEKIAEDSCNDQSDSGNCPDAIDSETQCANEGDQQHVGGTDQAINDPEKAEMETHAKDPLKVSEGDNQEKAVDSGENVPETDLPDEQQSSINETADDIAKDGIDDQNESESTENFPKENCTKKDLDPPSTTSNNTLGKSKRDKVEEGKDGEKSSLPGSKLGSQNSVPNSKSSTLQRPTDNCRSATLRKEHCSEACIEPLNTGVDFSLKNSSKINHRDGDVEAVKNDAKEWNDAVNEISDASDRESMKDDINDGFTKLAEHRSRVIDSHPLHDKILQSRRHYLLPVPSQLQLEALTPHRDCLKRENFTSEQTKTTDESHEGPPPAADTEGKPTAEGNSAGEVEQTTERGNEASCEESGGKCSALNSDGTAREAKPESDRSKPTSGPQKRKVGTVCHDVCPLQQRLIEKLQLQQETERCVPFSVTIPATAPNSVTLVPGPQRSISEPVGVIYELQVYAAKEAKEEPAKYKSTSFAVRKLQLTPSGLAQKTTSNLVSSKKFKCSPGEISLNVALNKYVYAHLEEIDTTVNLDNRSKKTVKSIVCEVVQQVNIGMTRTHFSRVVTTLESRDGCPVLPNYKIKRKFRLMPDVRYNKSNVGVAILGQLKDADCQLASTTLDLTENSLDRELGILVTYFVRVSLTFGSLSGILSVEHPIQLLPSRPEEYSDSKKSDVLHKFKGISDPNKICIEEFALLRKLKSLDETNEP